MGLPAYVTREGEDEAEEREGMVTNFPIIFYDKFSRRNTSANGGIDNRKWEVNNMTMN